MEEFECRVLLLERWMEPMDIDLATPVDKMQWSQDQCTWNEIEGIEKHHVM
jgi:hypothetical protein